MAHFFLGVHRAEHRHLIQAGHEGPPALAKTSEGKASDIERLVAPSLAEMGYDIVRVLLGGSRRGNSTARGETQGVIPQGKVEIPESEHALIRRFAETSPVLERLAEEHDRAFGSGA